MITLQRFRNKFLQLWQVELVRCYERDQDPASIPLLPNKVKTTPQNINEQLHSRALRLLKHYQLEDALSKSIKSLTVMVFVGLVLAFMLGIGLAKIIDSGATRELSLPWLLSALLGLNLVMYLFWFVMLFVKQRQNGLLGGFIQQGLRLFSRTPQAKYVIQSLLHTLGHYQLTKPILSVLSHVYWFLLLSAAALTLGLLFLFQSYSFSWETTVLNLPFMNHLSELLGGSLNWFGLTLPNVETLQTANPEIQAEVGRWLIGMVLVYGCGLRLVTAFITAGILAVRERRLEIDKTQPGLSYLVSLLLRGPARAIDKDNNAAEGHKPIKQPDSGTGDYWLQLEHAQPVADMLTAGCQALGVLATISDVERLTEQLKGQPAASIFITIDNQLTPDRGNLRLLRGLIPLSVELHCYLIHEQAVFTQGWQTVLASFVSEYKVAKGVRISQAGAL